MSNNQTIDSLRRVIDRITAERDALQARLNAADQKDDDLREVVAMKDREHLEAQRVVSHVTKERDTLRVKLAERDALLREVLHYDMCQRTGDGFNLSDLLQRINLTIGGRA